MERGDKLYPDAIKAQCDEAIGILEQNNLTIENLQKRLQDFVIDDELVSQAYSALKLQISDYYTLRSAMMAAKYLYITQIEVELTIFDENSKYIYDKKAVTNELSKAFLIYQVMECITKKWSGTKTFCSHYFRRKEWKNYLYSGRSRVETVTGRAWRNDCRRSGKFTVSYDDGYQYFG